MLDNDIKLEIAAQIKDRLHEIYVTEYSHLASQLSEIQRSYAAYKSDVESHSASTNTYLDTVNIARTELYQLQSVIDASMNNLQAIAARIQGVVDVFTSTRDGIYTRLDESDILHVSLSTEMVQLRKSVQDLNTVVSLTSAELSAVKNMQALIINSVAVTTPAPAGDATPPE